MLVDSRFSRCAALCFALMIQFAQASPGVAEDAAAGKQVETELVSGDEKIAYLIHLPKEYSSEPNKRWPMVLFLHGRGESYGPLSLVAKWGPPQIAAKDPSFPYILVSPQCPGETSWTNEGQQKLLMQLLDKIIDGYRIDTDRVYLTGLSMGGFGSWKLAAANPGRFAAVVPICGGGDPSTSAALTALPIWVFHGDQDQAVPISKSDEMVKAIQAAGGKKIRYTTLEHVGHNSWEAAYHTPELYEWLNQQTISARK